MITVQKQKGKKEMTFEEHIRNCKDIEALKEEFIEYNSFTLGFETFLRERLGDEFDKLCTEYASKRANFWLKEMLRRNEA